MLSWVIQITIISIILIFLVHHLILFFKSTLTVPKIKDLVNTTSQKYENIYNVIKNTSISSDDYSLIDLIPKKEEESMKNELKNFLKKQLHLNESKTLDLNEKGTSIVDLDLMTK